MLFSRILSLATSLCTGFDNLAKQVVVLGVGNDDIVETTSAQTAFVGRYEYLLVHFVRVIL
jgi:hypothetical protein